VAQEIQSLSTLFHYVSFQIILPIFIPVFICIFIPIFMEAMLKKPTVIYVQLCLLAEMRWRSFLAQEQPGLRSTYATAVLASVNLLTAPCISQDINGNHHPVTNIGTIYNVIYIYTHIILHTYLVKHFSLVLSSPASKCLP
jgi:hypothetical protein